MLTLSLLRHGKSSWDDPDVDDHERPLAERGRNAARDIGGVIGARRPPPDLVLCSSALRARETLEIALAQRGSATPEVVIQELLYLAPATVLLGLVRKTARTVRHLLIVGHNPGLHALALDLTGCGLRRDIASMALKFPTCALAMLTFEADDWAEVRPAAGRLALFVAPGSLASPSGLA